MSTWSFFFQFLIRLFDFCWIGWVLYLFLLLTLVRYLAQKYFLPFCRLYFHFVSGLFCLQKLFSLMHLHLFIFNLLLVLLVSYVKKKKEQKQEGLFFFYCFSLGSFIVSDLNSLLHFKVIFFCDCYNICI